MEDNVGRGDEKWDEVTNIADLTGNVCILYVSSSAVLVPHCIRHPVSPVACGLEVERKHVNGHRSRIVLSFFIVGLVIVVTQVVSQVV